MTAVIKAWTEALTEREEDAAVLTNPANIYYASGFYTDPHERLLMLILFQHAEPILVCPEMEKTLVEKSGWHGSTVTYTDSDDPWESVKKALHKQMPNPVRIAVEKNHLSVVRFEKLQHIYPGVRYTDFERVIVQSRQVKSTEELIQIHQAVDIAERALETVAAGLREGVTERQVVHQLEDAMKQGGADGAAFETIVLFGEKSAYPHGVPSEAHLQKGDLVLVDLGARYGRFCSDMTRTWVFGGADELTQARLELVSDAKAEAIEACRNGGRIGDVDKAARDVLTEAGYGGHFITRVGHGLGMDVHEEPSIHGGNDALLEAGMVLTIEPGIYIEGWGGIRLEDDVIVGENGGEIMNRLGTLLNM
ncbi:Xaa-Pro aminopeptidase. Metallo peptidase. MEROPS family M24B [Marinococcus luteus]|uniref:Xaa-Pro aminopeptidase. Metallo peptidase. MEROPS family M24B n=1 Tax=Marinococcus luteus TaxID=1122204 RepID=A0A1H2TDE1_9BACI|nr:Xaa-Pro peptidase family protein [Marinococcus luteus]SDW41840.1 Xaa-Pro aminopeptidase. Metallo peptidase. MEROPS family M24B [Marinococcus luteus]